MANLQVALKDAPLNVILYTINRQMLSDGCVSESSLDHLFAYYKFDKELSVVSDIFGGNSFSTSCNRLSSAEMLSYLLHKQASCFIGLNLIKYLRSVLAR